MIFKMYVIRDGALADYGRPMFLLSDAQAMRMIRDDVNAGDKNNALCMHSEDFELFYLGEYDSQSGTFTAIDPVSLVQCKLLVNTKQ